MQYVSGFGYPTPPASPAPAPAFDAKCTITQPRYVPVAPEDRLGKFLGGSLQLTGILGTGAYGVVYSAVDVKTGTRYAVKTLSKFNADGTPLDRRQHAFQTREIRLHYQASGHRNVVSVLKVVDDPDCIYVVMDYCPEGDLFYNITERGQYVGKDALAKRVFLQILDAVQHCHSLGIFHRDLKPENILVTDNGETVKLADFGLATSSDRSEDYGCGSTFYMSPECLDHSSRKPFYFCAPNDVWSLGVILVNLTCGRNPWKQASFEDSTYRAFTRSRGFLKTILPLSDELNDILSRIFAPNPDQRITLPELRRAILACDRFTEAPRQAAPPAATTRPEVIHHTTTAYVDCEEALMDDDEYDEAFSPSSSDSLSDAGSYSSSDSSSSSAIEDESDSDDDLIDDIPEAVTPPPQQIEYPAAAMPAILEQPEIMMHPQQDFVQSYRAQQAAMQEQMLAAAVQHQQQQAKYQLPLWDFLRFVQPVPQVPMPIPSIAAQHVVPQMHVPMQHYSDLVHPVPFHHQVPTFAAQGCY